MTDDTELPKGKLELRRMAQDEVLHAIAIGRAALAERREDWPIEKQEAFDAAVRTQQDRIARFFGYDRFPFVGY